MKTTVRRQDKLLISLVTAFMLASCSGSSTRPTGADTARNKLSQLQSDNQLASRAPVEIKEAERAVIAAEERTNDDELARHLVLMADRKIEIARARAQSRLYEDQRRELSQQSEEARLQARTLEADRARLDAESARREAEMARNEADKARLSMDIARMDAEEARLAADEAFRRAEDLQQQIIELNARETDRGLVMTLGDVLFETGSAELKGGITNNLGKLAAFLTQYEDRTVIIEGHTDNVGSDEYNQQLSQRRADSVKSFLINQGVDAARITANGMGENAPIADNETSTGRQQNRRVEVIISNTNLSSM